MAAAESSCPYGTGDTVLLQGLQGRADLNGENGIVLGFDPEAARCCVQLVKNGEQMNVRLVNLKLVEKYDASRPAKRAKTAPQLHADIQALVERICDVEEMKKHVERCDFHEEAMHLDKLDMFCIKQGLTWLRAIEQEMLKISPSQESLAQLSKSCFKALGFQGPSFPTIDTMDKMKAKVSALESLVDIECIYARVLRIADGRSGKKKAGDDSSEEGEEDDECIDEEAAKKKKRPMTPYFRYLQDHREAIDKECRAELAEGEKFKPTAVAKRAAEKWKALPDTEKAVYQDPYNAEKAAHDQEKAEKKAKEDAEAWEADPLPQRYYRMLGCHLAPISRGSPVWCMIAESVLGTQPQEIAADSQFVCVDRMFSISRASEDKHYTKSAQSQNRRLLWYSGPLACWAGVLSNGLRLPQPETPFSRYNFGKGIYFSDMVSVAAASSGVGAGESAIVLLCEVALGKSVERHQADNRGTSKLPPGHHSVIGRGLVGPSGDRVLPDGVHLPLGPVEERSWLAKVPASERLPHNEYVVYSTTNIRMRYLLEVRLLSGSSQEEIAQARAETVTMTESATAPLASKRLSKKTSADQTLMAR